MYSNVLVLLQFIKEKLTLTDLTPAFMQHHHDGLVTEKDGEIVYILKLKLALCKYLQIHLRGKD